LPEFRTKATGTSSNHVLVLYKLVYLNILYFRHSCQTMVWFGLEKKKIHHPVFMLMKRAHQVVVMSLMMNGGQVIIESQK